MTTKEKVIEKVVVQVGGLKGLILEGFQPSVKENKLVNNRFKDTIKHPIHVALEGGIGDLRFAVLEICGLLQDTTNKNVRASILSNCEILAIEFELGDTPWFKIKASSRVFDEKSHTICTPKVDAEDGYEHFNTVITIIKSILEEVSHYVNKTKVISDEELMESFVKHGKGKGIDRQMLEEMSFEDRAEWLHKALEKEGFIVNSMHMSDIATEEEVDIDAAPEDKNEIDFDASNMNLGEREEEVEVIPSLKIESIDKNDIEELRIAEPVLVKAKK